MMRGVLVVLLAVAAGCASTPTRPIPPRSPVPPLDESFFAGRDPARPAMRVHLIDVGQGAATLIEFSCGAILIDAGGESNRYMDSTDNLVRYLQAFFASRPDLADTLALVVLTHPHIDHTRGAQVLFGEFKIDHLVTNGHTNSSGGRAQLAAMRAARRAKVPEEAINTKTIPAGGLSSAIIDPIACADGDPDIRVLWGAVDSAPSGWGREDLENENNQSVVVRVSLGQSSILVTGDLEQEDALIAKHAGTNALDVDVYEVGHHGSYNASSDELLAAMTPKLALIGCGAYDRKSTWSAWAYGHPRTVTIDRLERRLGAGHARRPLIVPVAAGTRTFDGRDMKAPIFATGWDSDVIVTMYATGELDVKTRRGE
jgi:competence protein ComEC